MARYLFCSIFLFSSICLAGLNKDIKINIEEPVDGGVYSGISNLRGWAIAPEGINRFLLSVYVDGEFAFYMFPYGQRNDVGNAYPDYLGSETGGFSMAFNYKDLTPGEHEIRVVAFDDNEDYNEAVATFTTERFVGSFISDDSEVDISTSETWRVVDNQTYLITGPTIEGEQWDFELKWDKASQGFKIQRIALSGSDNSSDSSGGGDGTGGNYACLTAPQTTYASSTTVVKLKNGAELNNYSGKFWSSSNDLLLFRVLNGRWYVLEIESDPYIDPAFNIFRVDLLVEPQTCFEPDLYEITQIKREPAGLPTIGGGDEYVYSDGYTSGSITGVDNGCPIDVGATVYIFTADEYQTPVLLDIQTAQSCDGSSI